MLKKTYVRTGVEHEQKLSWKPQNLFCSPNHQYFLTQAIGLASTFIYAMDGSTRELIIIGVAERLKYMYPSYWSARNHKPRAYLPEEEKNVEVWDQGQILFSHLASARAPVSEEKVNPLMNAVKLYRENPNIDFKLTFQAQQRQLLYGELYFFDSAQKLLKPLEDSAKTFSDAATKFLHLQQGYTKMMTRCEEYRSLRLLDNQVRQDVVAPMQATYLEH